MAAQDAQGAHGRAQPQVLAVDDGLGAHQLPVELLQRQAGGHHGVLDVEEAVVPGGELPALGVPHLRARVRRHHRQVHDLGHRHGELAHQTELLLVPARIDDQVDRHADAQPACRLQCLEVLVRADALAELVQPVGVERLHAEEHVAQPQPGPAFEDLLVAQQHVRAGLQVVLLADVAPLQFGGDAVAVVRFDEGDVVDDEDVGLPDGRHLLGCRLGRGPPVAASVERPGRAEGAVPRAAAGELDGGAGVQLADEIAVAAAHQITGGAGGVDALQHPRRGAPALSRHHPGDGVRGVVRHRLQQGDDDRLALAAGDRVHRALGLFEHVIADEGDAVAPEEDEAAGGRGLGTVGDLDGLGDVGQVVEGDAERLGLEGAQLTVEQLVREHLQIDHPHRVSRVAGRRGDPFQPQRLQAEKDLRVHQRAWVDQQQAHTGAPDLQGKAVGERTWPGTLPLRRTLSAYRPSVLRHAVSRLVPETAWTGAPWRQLRSVVPGSTASASISIRSSGRTSPATCTALHAGSRSASR
ncbi:hypothetical protein STAL104432_13155 [Streptomyces albus]